MPTLGPGQSQYYHPETVSEVVRQSYTGGHGLPESTKQDMMGKTPEALDTPRDDIYNIAYDGNVPNPWSGKYIGIPANYAAVGLVYAGSVALLYPVLVIKENRNPAFIAASYALVTIFWSYKIVFGFLSDCFPILGLKRKPYIIIGWVLCAVVHLTLGSLNNVTGINLVIIFTLANLGYVLADVSADGFMVWMAHREPVERRGRVQSLVYIIRELFKVAAYVILLFGFSGPEFSCTGWVDGDEPCKEAVFKSSMTLPQYGWVVAGFLLVCISTFWFLYEEKAIRETVKGKMQTFWKILQKTAVWQIVMYTILSNILFGVGNQATDNTNAYWLGLSPFQAQLLSIFESAIFFISLISIRKCGLHFNWRWMIASGSLLQILFGCLYLIIVYDVYRNPWLYVVMDVSSEFTFTLNFLAGVFCIVEVAEPGYESITYALVTSGSNMVGPLSSVISSQLLSAFPSLTTAESIMTDTMEVRNDYTMLFLLVTAINLSSFFALPLLLPQRRAARELVARGGESKFWAANAVIVMIFCLIYTTVVNFLTVLGGDDVTCSKLLGGQGCEGESSVAVLSVLALTFLYTYGCIFYLVFVRNRFKR